MPLLRAAQLSILSLSFALALAACGKEAASEKTPAASAAPIAVGVATVGASTQTSMLRLSGTVRARQESTLSFPVGGRLSRVTVNEGDRVGAGQLLAQIEMVEVDAGLAAARAELARAEAEAGRMRQLFAKGWVTRSRKESAEAAAAAARAQVASRGFAQRYARITAPASGVVLARLAEPGQIVAAGTPILSVTQGPGGYVLRVALTDTQMANLRVGQVATVTIPALGDQPIAARIIELAGRGDPRTGTFEAELALPPLAALRSGMIGESRLPVASKTNGLAVPASAVWQVRADEGFVFVVDAQNRARTRRITVGTVDPQQVEVLAGLQAGERVISEGLGRVRPGIVVSPRSDTAK